MKLLLRSKPAQSNKTVSTPLDGLDAITDKGQFVETKQRLNLLKLMQPVRIALYSHDTMGLGHKRRNLLIAQTLARSLSQCRFC